MAAFAPTFRPQEHSCMALFSKPPGKKPGSAGSDKKPAAPAAPGGRPGTLSAREVAAQVRPAERPKFEPVASDITVTGASIIEWTPSQPAIEVAQANPGLCAVLENAALLYASGQSQPARTLLEQGVQSDHDTKLSPLAWLALFDVLQRQGDRTAFDQFALQYVVQFERSPPPWEEKSKAISGVQKTAPGGYVALSGRLTGASAQQIEALRRAAAKNIAGARVDLASVTGFDDDGATLLASALADVRRKGLVLKLLHPEKLRLGLEALVKKGRDGGEGAWLLSLELMQWTREQEPFDERAISYAVTFEVSPPSWEPPPTPAAEAGAPAGGDADPQSVNPDETLAWSGVITGSAARPIAELSQFAQGRAVVPLDLSSVERIDFVCAGALLNAVDRIESQRKAVQILGASPIIRALLLLIGISPRHFIRKSA